MFLGMRGNGDWVNDQRPKSWNQQILKLYPNGQAPLTAMLSMTGGKKETDPEFNWWTQEQSSVSGTVSGVYTDSGLTTLYTSGAVAGNILYISITTVLANRVREGHQMLLQDASDWRVAVNAKVTGVTRGTTNSTIAVKLLEDDDNSPAYNLSNCDTFLVNGNINPEGGTIPESIALNPTKVYNYTQIFRTPLSITRTALETELRTGDQLQKAKAEALEMHSWEMEHAFWTGIRSENIGANGKPERTTMGAIPFIRQYASANCDDYTLNATYTGQSWITGGETWLKNMFEQLFRYGADEKMAFVGSGVLLGIDKLAMTSGQLQLVPGQKTYGMQIREWVTPFGSIYVKTHPLFSANATTRNMMAIIEPKELEYKFITDTKYINRNDPATGDSSGIDGTISEYLTECGLKFGLPQKCAVLNGVGLDNSL